MLDEAKKIHRPTRLQGYDYSSPGYYFVTFNTKVRAENILCSIENVGPAPLGGPAPKGNPIVKLTQAGEILRDLIENIHRVYLNAGVDSYVIMPDHVHLLLYFDQTNDGPPRGAGPTQRRACLPQVINALKSLASKKAGFSLWQRGYHDHIVRNDADLRSIREYIQNNSLRWIQDKD